MLALLRPGSFRFRGTLHHSDSVVSYLYWGGFLRGAVVVATLAPLNERFLSEKHTGVECFQLFCVFRPTTGGTLGWVQYKRPRVVQHRFTSRHTHPHTHTGQSVRLETVFLVQAVECSNTLLCEYTSIKHYTGRGVSKQDRSCTGRAEY